MKTSAPLLAMFAAFLLAGCETLRRLPTVEQTTAKVDGQLLDLETRKLDERTYEITVFSDTALSEKQLLDVWLGKADKLAAGRPYEKQAKVEPWERQGFHLAGESAPRYPGIKVTGHIVLK